MRTRPDPPSPPRVLSAIANPEIAARLEPLLASAEAKVLRVNDGGSFALATRRAFDLVIAQCPLSGMGPSRILECLYESSTANDDTPTVLLTREAYLPATESIPHEHRRTVAVTTSLSDGLRAIAHALGLGDRAVVRLMVQLEMENEARRFQRVCQTKDVSPSGMLLRTARVLPVGAILPFSIELPEDPEPIHGRAEVVRHTRPDRAEPRGMGVRFLGLDGDGPHRLGGFIATRRAALG